MADILPFVPRGHLSFKEPVTRRIVEVPPGTPAGIVSVEVVDLHDGTLSAILRGEQTLDRVSRAELALLLRNLAEVIEVGEGRAVCFRVD